MYCVYLTEYFGNKMPKYYVGSSSIKNIEKGYKGSVSSKEFKHLWKNEIIENPYLFETKIISKHDTREEALEYELKYQIENDVIHNPEYMNKSLAKVYGFFGMNVSGENNPMYGKNRTGEKHTGGDNISKSLKKYYQTDKGIKHKNKMSKLMSSENNPMYGKKHSDKFRENMSKLMSSENNPMYGKKHSDIAKQKMRESKLGEKNPSSKLRKKYLVNNLVIDNAKKFCEENNLAYTNFIKYADTNKTYKGFFITRMKV